MLRYANYNIVFQEIPGEVTLAINLSNCPNRCKGCHSPYLQVDEGTVLDQSELLEILHKYGSAVTCVCFMGGDAAPHEVEQLSLFLKSQHEYSLKTGWYSGKNELPPYLSVQNFDFIKIGAYEERCGGLDSPTTNQRFYRIEQDEMIDETERFRNK
ncbi:anaerobic ribonucleoside-triphosphate reductase activating protein [Bacteroides sp. 214]|uniref:anaerobic ribonucleoside-triphosphate reductase activating protein n=1 Tax=Bacteroides sp. 214 TaxID=2302935 RepID=UPI0013D6EF93|nr:anaerobic ribonucleoside-triphosphate reductase activating protein [Bacteroides sp. 214]NDW12586.1 anaerobic ribonucleoside-triphosphate reductase activating protein [Bacteroides sp. 214]